MGNLQAQPTTSLEEKLDSYNWNKRVLLVIAPSEKDRQLVKQRELLQTQEAELQNRDMEIIYLPLDKVTQKDKEYLAQTFSIEKLDFYSILIGKDGGEKLRSSSPIDHSTLFGTIDAMPMRRQEMKKN